MDRFDQPLTPIRPARDRRGRIAALALLGAVLVVIVAVVAGTQGVGPAPSPVASVVLVAPSSSIGASPPAVASASPRPSGTVVPVTPSPSPAPTVQPTYPPTAFADQPAWRVSLYGVAALIVDPARRVVGVAPAAMRFFTIGFTGGVLPADSDHAVDVYWRSSICAAWELVTLDPGGTITVNTTLKDTACASGPTMRGLELRFATKVEARSFKLVVGPGRQYVPELNPVGVAFADPKHGLVIGEDGLVAVGETTDGGASWHLTTIGDGMATGLGLAGATAWTAIACDPSQFDHCAAGVYRREGVAWTRVLAMDPGPMAAQGDAVAVLNQPLGTDSTGFTPSPTAIELSRDAGATWTSLPSPCPATLPRASAVAIGLTGLLVVCEVDPITGGTDRALLASADTTGTAWTVMPQLPQSGSGSGLSTLVVGGPSPSPRVYGLLWGYGSPLSTSSDGGARWTAHPKVADGVVRLVRSASAGTGKAMTALVYDPKRDATLLLISTDAGTTWRETASFLALPCCGG